MKNCDEMVCSLLERRDKYIAEQKRKRAGMIHTASSMCCVCLVFLFGFGVWRSGTFDTAPPAALTDSITIGEKDYIDPDELNTNAALQISENNANMNSESSSPLNGDAAHSSNDYSPGKDEKTIISSYNVLGTPSASYETPENSEFYFSVPLRQAMNDCKDSVLYRVVVDVFSNKEQLSPDSSQALTECERLSNLGYIVAYESIFDGESYHHYFTLHATYEELSAFAASEDYGYFMFLYDERVELTVESPISPNCFG